MTPQYHLTVTPLERTVIVAALISYGYEELAQEIAERTREEVVARAEALHRDIIETSRELERRNSLG